MVSTLRPGSSRKVLTSRTVFNDSCFGAHLMPYRWSNSGGRYHPVNALHTRHNGSWFNQFRERNWLNLDEGRGTGPDRAAGREQGDRRRSRRRVVGRARSSFGTGEAVPAKLRPSDSGDLLAGVRAYRLIEDCFDGDVYHMMHRRKTLWSCFHLLDRLI